jgi:DDE family transposase
VVYKAEVMAQGPNTRFVVTTRPDPPLTRYNCYVRRGEPEQWIADLKNGGFADRLSCHRFWANQFPLLLHAAAYWLLDTLRRWLSLAGVARSQLGTLRLRVLKVGGGVREQVRGVQVHLASSHPGASLWRLLAIHFPPS